MIYHLNSCWSISVLTLSQIRSRSNILVRTYRVFDAVLQEHQPDLYRTWSVFSKLVGPVLQDLLRYVNVLNKLIKLFFKFHLQHATSTNNIVTVLTNFLPSIFFLFWQTVSLNRITTRVEGQFKLILTFDYFLVKLSFQKHFLPM